LTTAKQVQMQVVNNLAAIRTGIDDQPVARLRDSIFLSQFLPNRE
jgi:hypothetical protein